MALAAEPTLHVDLGGGVGIDLVLIPAGTFVEGSPPREKGREDGEDEHEVRITEPYYLGKVPVTVGAFGRFVNATSYKTEAERGTSGGSGWDGKTLVQRPGFNWRKPGFTQADDHPVTLVTYDDALAFAAWLSRMHGRAFTLPTEAQWERAYRAGTRGAYYEGANERDALALGWFKANAGGGTHPVGQKKANAFGLHDMAGNVFEWCLDWYAPYTSAGATDPLVTQAEGSDKPRRVLRGGSWLKDASHGRAASRYRNTPGSRNADNGFRVAAAPEPLPPGAAPPAPPATAAAAPPYAPPHEAVNCGQAAIGLGCFGTVIAFVVMLLVLLVRAATRAPVAFRMCPDGFKILAPGKLGGGTLHYRYREASGAAHEGQVVIEPSIGGQFVYTGVAPVKVEVVRLVRPVQASAPVRYGSRSGPVVYRQPVQHHHDDGGFRGFPPAY